MPTYMVKELVQRGVSTFRVFYMTDGGLGYDVWTPLGLWNSLDEAEAYIKQHSISRIGSGVLKFYDGRGDVMKIYS